MREMDSKSKSADFMRNLRSIAGLPRNPRAILVVSAHWEESEHTVLTSARPGLYFDYYGFPDHTYKLEWPVPGAPDVAKLVVDQLKLSGIKCLEDSKRGLDHGVFVPLKLAYPEADVPVLQLSLKKNLDIADHLRLGEALQPLRTQGILIIGSGQTTHNFGAMGVAKTPDWCHRFGHWFHDALTNTNYTAAQRRQLLANSQRESSFSSAHPRIEHYLPSIVVCAAAGFQPGVILYEEIVLGAMMMSSVKFQ
jgi:aromatic ring-opening dioxygenase catalytic subunit (LigB family)